MTPMSRLRRWAARTSFPTAASAGLTAASSRQVPWGSQPSSLFSANFVGRDPTETPRIAQPCKTRGNTPLRYLVTWRHDVDRIARAPPDHHAVGVGLAGRRRGQAGGRHSPVPMRGGQAVYCFPNCVRRPGSVGGGQSPPGPWVVVDRSTLQRPPGNVDHRRRLRLARLARSIAVPQLSRRSQSCRVGLSNRAQRPRRQVTDPPQAFPSAGFFWLTPARR